MRGGRSNEQTAIALTEQALTILSCRKQTAASEFVFPARRSKTGHIVNIKEHWYALRKSTGLEDLNMHDLRHTAGSW
ncbi:MAG: hypothetical protein WCJ35_15795 [Planctomycetota bacterium]